jgi:hypothetical protein
MATPVASVIQEIRRRRAFSEFGIFLILRLY